ncbi:enoyl-CoA hydratase/isomerase family protein [Castellaniella sp.]|uniref:enoyl-CoA hydratase/isomerase family protein n=1 Tax=Castellaniella sp. TaxID=1955812 RepID=UPI00355EA7F6
MPTTAKPADTAPASPLLYELDDHGIARIRFNRPQALNAIDTHMADAFLQCCRTLAQERRVRVIHLSGAGRAFMAGGDVQAMRAAPEAVAAALIRSLHDALRLLAQQNAPIVCTVQGAVAGAGLGVMLNADFVLADRATRFGVAYPLIGTSCDCSTSWLLPRMVGLRKATELALLGDMIEAEEALRLGLINQVLDGSELASTTERLLQRLAKGPTIAYGQLRRLLRTALQHDLDAHLDAEAAGFITCTTTQDFREGVAAFVEKRPAQFKGA